MISKEKIKNLFDKNIPIYGIDYRRCLQPDIVKIPVRNLRYCPSNDNYQYLSSKDGDCYLYEFFNEDLYETQEDAEFAKEFKNIERTEILNLPTFEELKNFERFNFKAKDGHRYTIHFISGSNILVIAGIFTTEYYGEATKENYLEACKIAKKLFLGDNE